MRPLSLELAERSIVDRRRSFVAWAIGIVTYCLLIVSIYPTIRDSEGYAAAIEDYPEALKELFGGTEAFDFTSGAGFLNAQLFSLMIPLLLVIVAIGFGASIGGEQESGLMDLVMANPVRRRRVVLERALAMTAFIVGLATVAGVVVVVAGSFFDLEVSLNRLLAATVGVVLLVVLHGLVAIAVGSASGQRSTAVGVATAVFAAGYLLNALAGLVDSMEPARLASPYHHAIGTNPLLNGWPLGNLLVLVGLCAAVLALSVVLFERRDVT